MLNRAGSNLYRFPEMEQIEILDKDEPETLAAEYTRIGIEQYGQLNNIQKIFIDPVVSAIDSDNAEQTCFYINGPGGSGKTFTYTTRSNLV